MFLYVLEDLKCHCLLQTALPFLNWLTAERRWMNFFTFGIFLVGMFFNLFDISVNVIVVTYLSTFYLSYQLIKKPQDTE